MPKVLEILSVVAAISPTRIFLKIVLNRSGFSTLSVLLHTVTSESCLV